MTPPVDVDVDVMAAAAAACPGVARLSRGSVVEVATYLPERRVHGVRVTDDAVDVHLVAQPGVVLPALAESVRSAVMPHAGGRRVDVYVDDLELGSDLSRPAMPIEGP